MKLTQQQSIYGAMVVIKYYNALFLLSSIYANTFNQYSIEIKYATKGKEEAIANADFERAAMWRDDEKRLETELAEFLSNRAILIEQGIEIKGVSLDTAHGLELIPYTGVALAA